MSDEWLTNEEIKEIYGEILDNNGELIEIKKDYINGFYEFKNDEKFIKEILNIKRI